jgi:hypothetical protein
MRLGLLIAALIVGPVWAQPVWIDAHMHLHGGAGQQPDYEGAVQVALAAMDGSGVRTAIVMPPPRVQGMSYQDWNSFDALLRRHPGRFAFMGGGGTLNEMLHDPRNAEPNAEARALFERTARDILAAGAVGFGEIAAHHLSIVPGHPYEWVAPDHPLLVLLADIAARDGVVIDLHLDLVRKESPPPQRLRATNPASLKENFSAFERLLAHNRAARIVWAHAGSHPLQTLTPELARQLLARHPNLFMSIRLPLKPPPEGAQPGPQVIVEPSGEIRPAWMEVLQAFPDRFVIGSDQFMASPRATGSGAGLQFSAFNDSARARTVRFLEQLPIDLARHIGSGNAQRLYRIEASR